MSHRRPVPLLERDAELQHLRERCAAARHGRGSLVLVEAAGGLGKTRLLGTATDRVSGELEVLRVSGAELEQDHPFGVVVELFGPRLRRETGDDRRALLTGAAGLAADLLAGRPVDAAARSADGSLLHGLHWLVANLADRGPLVLVVDDAQWADAPSLRFLCYLARRLVDLPVALVVAHRPVGAGPEPDLLAGLAAVPGATRLTLSPLGLEAVTKVVAHRFDPRPGSSPDADFTVACHTATGGNPLLLDELLVALEREGVAPDAQGARRAHEIGPRSVGRSVELQLRRLGANASALAHAAAVLGDGEELADAAMLAGLGTSEAAQAATALARAGLLSRGGGTAFAHPIVRQAVLEQLDPGERASAHREAARLLHGRADVERVAAHLLSARVDREPWALCALKEAADRALARGVPSTAARLLQRAREEAVEPSERAALAAAVGRAAAQAGEPGAAALLESALDEQEGVARVAVLLDLGQAHLGRGIHDAAVAAFGRGLEELAALGDDHEDLRLELECGYVAAGLWLPSMGVVVMDRVAPFLRPDHVPRSASERALLAALGGGEMLRCGDRDLAVDLACRAWGRGAYLGELGPDDPSLSAITGVFNQADELVLSHDVCDATLDAARAVGSLTAFGTFSYIRGATRFFQGRLADAISDLEAAREAEQLGWEQYLAAARWMLTLAALAAGDVDRARSATLLDPEVEARVGASATFAPLPIARGLVALHDGNVAAAVAEFEQSAQLQAAMGLRNPAFVGWRIHLSAALGRLGERERARAVAEEDLALTEAWGAPRALCESLLALARVTDEAGRRRELLERGVAVVEGGVVPLTEALAWFALGSALRRDGKRALAQQPLRSALDLADRCGAAPLAARAREELATVGVRPRRARLSGPASLTPSERRVARLAAGGLTNREIAESLFVTRKAIEYHLGNVYRKLGVSSRGDLPQLLDDGPQATEA